MKSKARYVKFPLDVYALGPFRFEHPKNEREVREYVRDWESVSRLPNGTQFWPTNN